MQVIVRDPSLAHQIIFFVPQMGQQLWVGCNCGWKERCGDTLRDDWIRYNAHTPDDWPQEGPRDGR